MLRSRSSIAVIFSIILVFGAAWVRYTNAKESADTQNNDGYLENNKQLGSFNTKEDFLNSLGSSDAASSTKLTDTDLIARQMFSDYMNLVSKGQATPENINKLAIMYGDSLKKGDTTIYLNISQLKIVTDSDIALKNYGLSVFGIKSKYQSLIKQKTSQFSSIQPGSQGFSSFMNEVSKMYTQSAHELENVPVPTSLSANHLKLINNLLSSANAAKLLTDLTNDPARTYVAINTQSQNEQDLNDIYTFIQTSLSSKGIFFDTNS